MIIIGIVLLLIALAAIGFVIYGSSDADPVRLEAFGLVVETSPLVLFLAGAAVLLLALLGLLAMRVGARRSARNRSEISRLRRVEAEAQARQAEEAQRQAELDRRADAERQAAAQQVPTASTATVTTTTSQPVEETTVLRRESTGSDTPFGREPAADTVVTKSAGTDSTSSGATASGAGGDSTRTIRPDAGPTDSSRL